MNRRRLLTRTLAGAGAVATAKAQKIAPKTSGDGWKPRFFDNHQNETVVALTDLIIPATDTPGAKQAQVNRFIDLMLSASPAEAQRRFLQGLAWLDGYSLRTYGAPFVKCSASQQTNILKSLDSNPGSSPELKPGAAFFREIKRRTVSGYYSSKAGYAELNKGGRVPASFGCTHSGHSG